MQWFRPLVPFFVLFPVAVGGMTAPDRPGADRLVAVADFEPALLAQEIFHASNVARAKEGLPPLSPEPRLAAAASDQAAMLAMRVHSGHRSPLLGHGDASARVQEAGLGPGVVAENAATMNAAKPDQGGDYTYAELAKAIVQAWMDSPGHRANLLNPSFHFLGCGARIAWVLRGEAVVYAIQDFYAPARVSDPPPPSIRPTAPSLAR